MKQAKKWKKNIIKIDDMPDTSGNQILFCLICGHRGKFNTTFEEQRYYAVDATCDEETNIEDYEKSEWVEGGGDIQDQEFSCPHCGSKCELSWPEDIWEVATTHIDTKFIWHARAIVNDEDYNQEIRNKFLALKV